MKKQPANPLPKVIPAPPELLATMQKIFAKPPVSFEVAKAQTDRVLADRNGTNESKAAPPSGRLRKAD